MPRHAYQPDQAAFPSSAPRIVAVVLVWLVGIAAGMYCLLSIGIRFAGTCTSKSGALACHSTGTAIGIALVLAVIVVVTTATVSTHRAGIARTALICLFSLILLALTVGAAHWLLGTA